MLERRDDAEFKHVGWGPGSYNSAMSAHIADYLVAIRHLPDGAAIVIQQFNWADYERLLERKLR